jgi:catechol 2,3-dioxygenase-like lactoylglutathione lyase family enzyme
MTSRVIAVTVDCHDVDRLVLFWSAALGSDEIGRWRDAHGKEYVRVGLGAGVTDAVLLLHPCADPKVGKNRLHLDLAALDGTQADELDRLTALGATLVDDDPEVPWVVLADPEGNEFCILPPVHDTGHRSPDAGS